MLRPEDILMAVTANLTDDAPAPNGDAAQAAPTPENKEVKQAVDQIKTYNDVDFLQSDAVLNFFCNHKITLSPSTRNVLMECIHKLNYAPNTDDIIIHFNSREDHAAFKLELTALMAEHLGRDSYSIAEFQDVVMLNPDFLAGLCGFRNVVCDRDSVSNNNQVGSKLMPFETKELKGLLEVKLPYFLMQHGPKILAYILRRLEKNGFSPSLFENIQNLPNLEELLLTLPDMPKDKIDYATQQLFAKYEQLGILRLQESLTAIGFIRVLADNFEKMITGLSELPTTDATWAAGKLKEASIPSLAIAINPLLLMQMIAAMQRSQGIKPLPNFRIGNPVQAGKQALVPARIEVPHSHNLISRPTLTIIICDTSGSMGNNGRVIPQRTAVVDQCQQLALLPNQMVCGIRLGKNGGTIQEPTALNRITLPKILEVFNAISGNEDATNILPTLRDVKKYIDAADLKMDVQVLLITDGIFDDQNDAEVVSILGSTRKVVWRALGLDLKPGGTEERNMSFLLTQTEEQGGRQLVFCPKEEVKLKMGQLIAKTVPVSLLREVSLNIPLKGNEVWTKLQTFSRGLPVFRHLPVPTAMLEAAKAMKLQNVPIRIKCVNQDGKTQILSIAVPYVAFTKMQTITEFNALHFAGEWLQSRCLTDNLGAFDALSYEVLMRLYTEASELELPLVCGYLNERLKPHLDLWFADNMKKATGASKMVTLEKLRALLAEVTSKRECAFMDLIAPEVEKLKEDPELFLESFLFKDLKVNTTSELAKKPLNEVYASYEKALNALAGGNQGIKIGEGVDVKALQESVLDKISLILCQVTICSAADIKLLAEDFTKFSADQSKLGLVLTAFEKALAVLESEEDLEEAIKARALTWLKQQIDALWIPGNFALMCTSHSYNDREKLSPALLLTYLRRLKDKAESEGRPSQSRLLKLAMDPIWMDGTLCLYVQAETKADVKTKEEFNNCNPRIRFLAYQHAMDQALNEEREAICKKLMAELDAFWLEGAICAESKKDSIADFQKLSIEEQLQAYANLEKTARQQNREKDVQQIAKLVAVLEDNQFILQFAKNMLNVNDLKTFSEQPVIDKIKVLKWASLTAESQGKPSHATRLLEKLNAVIASTESKDEDLKEKLEADSLLSAASKMRDFNELLSDAPFSQKITFYHKVINDQKNSNPAMATLIEERLLADTYIMDELKRIMDPLRQPDRAVDIRVQAAAAAVGQVHRDKDGKIVAKDGKSIAEKYKEVGLNPILNTIQKGNASGLRRRYRQRGEDTHAVPNIEVFIKKLNGVPSSARIGILEQIFVKAENQFGKGSKKTEIIQSRILQRIDERLPRLMHMFGWGRREDGGGYLEGLKNGGAQDFLIVHETETCVSRYLSRIRRLLDMNCFRYAAVDPNFVYYEETKKEEEDMLVLARVLTKEVAPAPSPKQAAQAIKNIKEIVDLIQQEFAKDPKGACRNLVLVYDEKEGMVKVGRGNVPVVDVVLVERPNVAADADADAPVESQKGDAKATAEGHNVVVDIAVALQKQQEMLAALQQARDRGDAKEDADVEMEPERAPELPGAPKEAAPKAAAELAVEPKPLAQPILIQAANAEAVNAAGAGAPAKRVGRNLLDRIMNKPRRGPQAGN